MGNKLIISITITLMFISGAIYASSKEETEYIEEDCPACEGMGKLICEECNAHGYILQGLDTLDCTLCNGSGIIDCRNCNNMGKVYSSKCYNCKKGLTNCASCSGTGEILDHISREVCSYCYGSGRQRCNSCNGRISQTIKCRSCNGEREIKCPACNGTHRNSNIAEICKRCKGTEKIKCMGCNGKGTIVLKCNVCQNGFVKCCNARCVNGKESVSHYHDCRDCCAKGKIRCSVCSGEGRIITNFPVREMKCVWAFQSKNESIDILEGFLNKKIKCNELHGLADELKRVSPRKYEISHNDIRGERCTTAVFSIDFNKMILHKFVKNSEGEITKDEYKCYSSNLSNKAYKNHDKFLKDWTDLLNLCGQ